MVCDMIFIYPLLDFSIHVIGSTPLLLLHYLTEKKKKVIAPIEVRTIGAWGLQHPPPSPRPSRFWAAQIFGVTREIWANQIFTKVFMFRFFFFFL